MPKKLSNHSSSAKVFSLSTFDYTQEYFLLDLMCNWEQLVVCFYLFEVSCELFCSLWLHFESFFFQVCEKHSPELEAMSPKMVARFLTGNNGL